jgi:hypothetical protein
VTSLCGDGGWVEVAGSLPERFCFFAGHVWAESLAPDIRQASADALNGVEWAFAAGHAHAEAARLADFIRALGATPVVVADQDALRLLLRERRHAV